MAPLTGSGSMIGRVVDADSGKPIAGALVTAVVTPKNPPAGGLAQAASSLANIGTTIIIGPGMDFTSPRIVTDAAGSFVFRNLPAGAYQFETSARGYSGGEYRQLQPDGPGQALDLADGQHVADITIKGWKDAAISGRVVDEAGDPVVGVFVRVLRRVMNGGQPALQQFDRGEATDDRGMYRAHGLTVSELCQGGERGEKVAGVGLENRRGVKLAIFSRLDRVERGFAAGPPAGRPRRASAIGR
jgi:Carboxypeptidase regulatory-like domain